MFDSRSWHFHEETFRTQGVQEIRMSGDLRRFSGVLFFAKNFALVFAMIIGFSLSFSLTPLPTRFVPAFASELANLILAFIASLFGDKLAALLDLFSVYYCK